MEERRVADYFVVAGLPANPLPLEEYTNEAVIKPTYKQDPITDITIINKSIGEKVPKGFTCLERTVGNLPADLNHGSIRCHEMYICYRRSRDKAPLTDVGVLYEGKERLMPECEVVHTTHFGSPANVNNSSSGRTYITFRRAKETAASDTLTVVDIAIILSNKGELPQHAYHKIDKNLNRGMVGSDVYLCYKKAMTKIDVLAYHPAILDRYPEEDHSSFPLPVQVPLFCLPMGATIECWSAKAQHPLPVYSTFVLTGSDGAKLYGAAVTFYEEFPEERLTDLQMRHLGLKNKHIREQYRIHKSVHSQKSICLLSHWPFFDVFRKFLTYLYRISITGPHTVPLERHISHFMYDVPYPSPQRPRILVQLSHDSLSLSMPEDSPLPQSGASYITMLTHLGAENCMNLLLYVLLEQKILLHSLRPAVLTGVAEAVSTMLFPLHWQCAYIPLCPLGLCDVLSAPIPYIVGVDSRYFDLYDPPSDVICVDLDTITITVPDDKKHVSFKQFPKRPCKVLQNTLGNLFERLCTQRSTSQALDEVSLELAPMDSEFKRKRKDTLLELEIQESFLRFMACILKGYKNFLKPITTAPTNETTDPNSLFDMQGFLRSREKSNIKFFQQMTKTQCFIRFIEERSLMSYKDASLAFFDECTEKVDENRDEPKLIEIDDSHNSERTVFILPPEPVGLPEGMTYSYNGFPELKHELFLKKKVSETSLPGKSQPCPHSPLSRRFKQEIKTALKLAQQHMNDPMLWAKCLLSHCYSLWFIHLPAYVSYSMNKEAAMKAAYDVLLKMTLAKLQLPDEVNYRVMLQLCREYNMPVLAVKVLSQMKSAGIQPNAITYGYYNKAVFESTWTSSKTRGAKLWKKIRNVVFAVAQFRRTIRRRSMSLCSNSGSECDKQSIDSALEEHSDKNFLRTEIVHQASTLHPDHSHNPNIHIISSISEESTNTDTPDTGYNSLTQAEAKSMKDAVSALDQKAVCKDLNQKNLVLEKKKESKFNLRFHLNHKQEKKQEHQGVNKNMSFDASDVDTSKFNPHACSIVKSVGSFSSVGGSHDTLKGSMLSLTSTGLLMVNEGSTLEATEGSEGASKRRRHKSAGDNKVRSNSVCSNWRPRHVSGPGGRTKLLQFSDLSKQGSEDDIFGFEHDPPQEELEISQPEDYKDSGVVLDERISFSDMVSPEEMDEEDTRSSEQNEPEHQGVAINIMTSSSSNQETLSSSVPMHSIGTPVTSNDPLGLFMESHSPGDSFQATLQPSVIFSGNRDKSYPDVLSDSNSEELLFSGQNSNSPMKGVFGHEVTPAGKPNRSNSSPAVDHKSDTFSLGSIHSLDACNIGSQPLSPVERVGKKLMEIGRTSSIPDSLESSGKGGRSSLSQVKGYLQSFASPLKKSTDSLDGKEEMDSGYIRKLGSFKKHGERLSGALRFASGALANKFTELMTTPSKMGSQSSLHSNGEGECDDTHTPKHAIDVPRRPHGRPIPDRKAELRDEARSMPNGSLPSSSFMEQYIPLREFGEQKTVHFASLQNVLKDIAIETEISSCCRCPKCRSLLYDEEIMAGWMADDSNLNTICIFCQNRLVPKLQIYIKDWRDSQPIQSDDQDDASSFTEQGENQVDSISETSSHDIWIPQEGANISALNWDSQNLLFFGEERHIDSEDHRGPSRVESPMNKLSSTKDGHLADLADCSSPEGSFSSPTPNIRQRCTSECLTSCTDYMYGSSFDSTDNFPMNFIRSPLNMSIGEDTLLPTRPADIPEMKKDIMDRGTTTMDPIAVPYLSPLVLRKELENILGQEGDLALSVDGFLDEHPIIYWNLVWYFKRIEVPSHMPGFLLSAQSLHEKKKKTAFQGAFDSQHVLIRPQWDNIRIHEEVGLPMYKIYVNNAHNSHIVDALITEQQVFTKAVLHQIITSIQCNDVLSPLKLVTICRRRLRARRCHHRSMYRDILFLALTACGRDRIDHDAFDREYRQAFHKLQPMEMKKMQRNDRPRKTKVIWCRKVFGELEV